MKLQFRKPLEDLVPYPPGKPIEEVQREYGLKSVVKLASNENPLGASPKAKQAICAGLDELHLYPESACYYLREKLAKHLNVAEETLFFGNGSDEIVQLLATAFLEPGTNVVFSNLAFVRYPMGAQMMGAERRPVPMKNWKHDIDGFLAAVDANTRFVFLSNPNNPVGSAVTTQEVERLLAALPKNVIVGIDEAYREYAADFPDYPDSLELMKKYENLISLRTFSKAYGLAGLRVGYGIGSPEIWGGRDAA